jgi:hypothetical protein
MVLKCESGPAEGKPQVEEYGLAGLAASAEAVLPGLGPLVAGLAGLAGEAGRAVTLDAMELLVIERGRELLRGVVQLSLDAQAAGEVRLAGVTGADGVPRTRAERGHARTIVTTLGPVTVRRTGYRARAKGVPALFPRDAVLNLPRRGYSWQLQQLAVLSAQSGSYERAQEFVAAATGVTVGKKQLEQITAGAAADAPGFYPALARQREQQRGQEPQAEQPGLPLGLSSDGKGVAMRPEARRSTARAPGQRVRNFGKRRGTGEKGHKRMAQAGCVFDVQPPAEPRTPEQVMCREPGQPPGGPEAVNRWYTVDIAADREHAIKEVFTEAGRRDPGHARQWVALVDGDNHQIRLFQEQAAARGIALPIIIDFIHVLEYLWKAAWCFHAPRDPAMEDWVTAQGLDILHGRAAAVISRIEALAAANPPEPGGEHAKIIRKTLSYLQNKQPYLDYPRALAEGWPIATGVIEGACRHLVQDRMGITGARWGLQGAQAILRLRAIRANGDLDTYWNHHIQQEHQRNHLSRYQAPLELAA